MLGMLDKFCQYSVLETRVKLCQQRAQSQQYISLTIYVLSPGPNCGTAGYPGSLNVIGVGSTTTADAISGFSSAGPNIHGEMKPDISAPGSNVVSASHLADDAYRSLSGTSMA